MNHRMTLEATPQQGTNQYVIKGVEALSIKLRLREANITLSVKELDHLILQKELSLPSPGRRLELYIEDQQLFIERIDFGLVSQLNELHQGRYTSATWKVVSDTTAIVFIFIAITGVWLGLRDAKQRRNYLLFLLISLATFILLME